MSLTFLMPDLARLAGDTPRLPALETLMARAEPQVLPSDGLHGILAKLFGLSAIAAVAPVTRLADTGERDDGVWFRADPVHLTADRDQLIMLPPVVLDVGIEEAQALADAFNRLYMDDGVRLEAPTPARWYLWMPEQKQMTCVTHDPESIAGSPVFDCMPSGPDSPRLRQLMNEIQMLFHEHPINQLREAAGKPTINTAWIWGGGRLPESVFLGPAQVVSDLPLVRGLGLLAGSECVSWNGTLDTLVSAQDGLLALRLESPAGLEAIEADVARTLLPALRRGDVRTIDIYPGGDRVYRVTHRGMRRFWRRRRPFKAPVGLA